MNITILISNLSNGGAERVVCNLSNYLAGRGHQVTVITVSPEQSYPLDKRVDLVRLCKENERKIPHGALNLLRISRLGWYFLLQKPDVYLTFLPDLSRVMLSFRRIIRAPIILSERGDPASYCNQNVTHRMMMEKYYPQADAYVFQTSDAKMYYANALKINVLNSIVIPNAINPEFIGHSYNGVRSRKIVSAGRLTEQKNFALLIDAYAAAIENLKNYDLVIYGEGPLRDALQKQINDLGLTDQIYLPGRTDNMIAEIEDASLFVLPSNYEGMPNALAEAMALGLPCIATDCPAGGSRFLIQDGINGLLVPTGDKNALVNAIKRVLTDEMLCTKLGRNAAQVQRRLKPEKVYARWEEYIKKVTSAKKCGAVEQKNDLGKKNDAKGVAKYK